MKAYQVFSLFLSLVFCSDTYAQISRLDKRFNIKRAQPVQRTVSRSSTPAKRSGASTRSAPQRQTENQNNVAVTFDGLYNGESITMPLWLWNEVKDLNEQLRTKIPPSDYLTILKGEMRLFSDFFRTEDDYLRNILRYSSRGEETEKIQGLRSKLKEIISNPTDDHVFPRPRFLTRNKEGVMFREYLRFTNDEISLGDDSYILSRKQGLTAGYSSLWTFWDARTGLPRTRFACQSSTKKESSRGRLVDGKPMYYLMETYNEHAETDWIDSPISCNECYIIDPDAEMFQVIIPGDFSQKGIVENPNGGLLYRKSSPLPLSQEPDAIQAPWYKDKESGKEFFYIPRDKGELDYAWGRTHAPQSDNLLFLDSLSQSHQTPKQQKDDVELLKKKIIQLMQPVPLGPADDELDKIDLGNTRNGYTLFTRYAYHYDEASSGAGLMFGILTPNEGALFFPVGEVQSFIPLTGKLKSYNAICMQNSGGSANIPNEYCAEAFAPYISTLLPNLSEDGEHLELVVGVEYNQTIELDIIRLNLVDKTYKVEYRWKFPQHALIPKWVSNRKIFMRPDSDYKYKIIQVEEDKSEHELADLYVESPYKYAIVLPNGHYAGTPGCESILEYGDGEKVIGMQALAPWRNRPAEVLEAIGGNADDIAALRETTKRWLRKQGFDPDNMSAEPAIQDFPAAEVQMPKLFSTSDTAQFTVTAKATANDIKKVIVRADGVQVPQSWDSELSVPAGEQKELNVEVPLATGQNWIEVTPVDSKGISGDTFRFRTIYKGDHPSDLYIVALGVSDYDNPDLKLQYAAKDAKDIAAAFEKYGSGRKHVLVLTDKEVKDKSVLEKVKIFLSAASLEDRIVFYIAGHGMLDDKYNYYYAPAGFDPERIVETGIEMDELTGCLQSAKARKRLLLLDTCHSGMLGEEGEEKLAMSGVELPHGVRAVRNRGMKVKKAIGALNTKQKKRYIEDLFSRGDTQRGINIIAGAAGAEFALESGEWNNGVFTASLMQALRDPEADSNKDGQESVEELQDYVARKVAEQTNGAQKPNATASEGCEGYIVAEVADQHGSTNPAKNESQDTQGANTISITDIYSDSEMRWSPLNPDSHSTSSPSTQREDRSDLQPLIDRMRALKCKQATSALYQKRLLTLLPMIRDGASVDVTLPETKGNTALHYACSIGSWGITEWLVNHGANVNAVTDRGSTPLDCVGDDNAARIRALLISRGAKRAAELSLGGHSGTVTQPSTNVAAANGDAEEQNNLGLAYQYGKGKPQNYTEAARCFRRAAEQGHAAAQNNLGFCYHNGWGVPQDYTQAAHWYRLSAEQGNAWGQSNYGTCLEFGWGVKKNLPAAIDMYRRAAAQGHASAKKHLKRHGISL